MMQTDKGQDITLMNSQCSDTCSDSQSSLYRAVTKSLKDDRCDRHNEKCQFYYDSRLLCQQCFAGAVAERNGSESAVRRKKYEFYYHLETILNWPIVLVIDEKELLSHPIELMQLVLSSYKQLYQKKNDFKVQKHLIDSFTSRIKNRVDQLCDEILASYNKMEETILKNCELKDDLKNLGMMYEDQMMEMLGQKFVQGNKSELETIFEEYSNSNESPLPKILDNLDEFMTSVASSPFIDIKAIEQIYTTVTDEKLWKTNELVLTLEGIRHKKEETADLIINSEEVQLQGQYTLNLNQNEATLTVDNKIIGILQTQIDSLYQLPNYKLLGVNYGAIMVINYFDQLTIEQEFSIPGCTDILPFPYHVIAISNKNLIKVSLDTKEYEVLGKNYKNLKYGHKNSLNFMCQNEDNELVTWNCFNQFLTHVVS